MTSNNSLKPYLFDSFYRWSETNNLDIYLEFKTNNINLPEYFNKKVKAKLKLSKKTCFDLKIHTNGITFFVYINKNKEDIFVPHGEWLFLSAGNKILDFCNLSIKEKGTEDHHPDDTTFPYKIHLAWDADKNFKNESVNKG